MIRFLANENVPLATVRRLQEEGFDVVAVSTDFPSISDESVILFASIDNRVIITFDRDYGELIFQHKVNRRPELFICAFIRFVLKTLPKYY
jgi:predicted nuclease of predicted toxin-antitoxin system